MNMKKTLAVVGAIALAGVLSVTAVGCAKKTRNLASLSSNWYYDSSFKKIQPTFTEEAAEKLTYKVTYSEPEEVRNNYYSVNYADGTYTTEFYAKKITATELAQITDEDWRKDYTNALSKDGYMYLYYYATELSIPTVTFTCKGESKTFDESVKTESYFLSVNDFLQPVYSARLVKKALPKEMQVSSIDECYSIIDMQYESFYTLSGSSVKTYITDNLAEDKTPKAFVIDGLNAHPNSVFDVAYLDITVRAMRNITNAFSQTIGIYTPGLQVRNYTVASVISSLFSGEDADKRLKDLQGLLEDKGLFTPENEESKLNTTAVSVTYNGGSFSGVSQTYWFAVDKNNETRTLMVKYAEPIVYNLGTLNYVLAGIDNIGD